MTDAEDSPERTRHVYALGAATWIGSIVVLLFIIFGPMYLIKWYWPTLSGIESSWSIPYLVGVTAGFATMRLASRLDDTRLSEWAIYAESYLETLAYPKNPKND